LKIRTLKKEQLRSHQGEHLNAIMPNIRHSAACVIVKRIDMQHVEGDLRNSTDISYVIRLITDVCIIACYRGRIQLKIKRGANVDWVTRAEAEPTYGKIEV
jgi:hypothetical protein